MVFDRNAFLIIAFFLFSSVLNFKFIGKSNTLEMQKCTDMKYNTCDISNDFIQYVLHVEQ